jgi:hypothetical protein
LRLSTQPSRPGQETPPKVETASFIIRRFAVSRYNSPRPEDKRLWSRTAGPKAAALDIADHPDGKCCFKTAEINNIRRETHIQNAAGFYVLFMACVKERLGGFRSS